jgi:Fe2+ or Zn2+ uptake regulation protein
LLSDLLLQCAPFSIMNEDIDKKLNQKSIKPTSMRRLVLDILIHSVDDGTGAVKYALCDDDCICNNCGQTHCLKEIPVPKLEMPKGFDLESANFAAPI